MRSGTKSVLSVLCTCFILWLGGKILLPLCFPFLLGTGLALMAEPGVRFLCTRLHLPRGLAAGMGVTAAFLGIGLLLLLFLAFVVRELGILAGILPDLTVTARSGIQLLGDWLLQLTGRMPGSLRPLIEQNVTTLFSGGTAPKLRRIQFFTGAPSTKDFSPAT